MQEQEVVRQITSYIQGLLQQEDGKILYDKHKQALAQIRPEIAFMAFHHLQKEGIPAAKLLNVLEKCMNAFQPGLRRHLQETQKPQPLFIDGLQRENEAMLQKLQELKTALQAREPQKMVAGLRSLADYESHLQKKENILFPYLEAKADHLQGLSIMWELHDRIRQKLKAALASLEDETVAWPKRHQALGKLFFALYGLVQKEELILFPVALARLEPQDFLAMLQHSQEEPWAYIETPRPTEKEENIAFPKEQETFFSSKTGHLARAQIEMIFSSLPVDITVIDASDRVCFFSRPQDRIFPRSPAIIGRPVERCHPPHSLAKVQEILAAFRRGEKSKARFWIQRQKRFILIEYFALRDESQAYQGTVEVSQDITDLKALRGERRLVAWQDETQNSVAGGKTVAADEFDEDDML